jgi:serine/threonine protein phosphatase PrpC
MAYEMRSRNMSPAQIAHQLVTDCCSNSECKDNVTVVVIDLHKHLLEYQKRVLTEQTLQKRSADSLTPFQQPFDLPSQKRYMSQSSRIQYF